MVFNFSGYYLDVQSLYLYIILCIPCILFRCTLAMYYTANKGTTALAIPTLPNTTVLYF